MFMEVCLILITIYLTNCMLLILPPLMRQIVANVKNKCLHQNVANSCTNYSCALKCRWVRNKNALIIHSACMLMVAETEWFTQCILINMLYFSLFVKIWNVLAQTIIHEIYEMVLTQHWIGRFSTWNSLVMSVPA